MEENHSIPQSINTGEVKPQHSIPNQLNYSPLDTKRSTNLYNAIYQPFDKYEGYIKNIYPNTDWNLQASQNQSGWEQLGFMLTKGVVGEVLAQGFIGGVGALAELPFSILEELSGKDADFSNFMTRFADDISEGLNEATPIFQENPNKSFDWNDSGWWYNNLTSVFSTLGLLIPAGAAVKGSKYFSKALQGLSETRKLKALSKGLNAASVVFDTDKYWQQIAHSAIAMRHAENFRESAQTFNTIKNEVITKVGNDPEEFSKLLNSPVGQEFLKEGREATSDELANFIASKASWKNYGMNYANLMFDVVQIAPIAKALNKSTRSFIKPASVIKAQAKELGIKPSALKLGVAYTAPTALLLGEQLSEGVEEAWNAISQNDANWYGRLLMGSLSEEDSNKTFKERLNNYLKDSSTWEQAFFGVIGGVANSGATRAISSIKDMIDESNDSHSSTKRVAEIQSRAATITLVGDAMRRTMEGIDPITNEKITGSDSEINDKKNEHLEFLSLQLADALGTNAAIHKNSDLLLDMVSHPNFAQILIDKGVSTEDNVTTTLAKLKTRIIASEKIYNDTYNSVYTSTQNEGLRRLIASRAVQRKSEIDGFVTVRDLKRSKALEVLISNPTYEEFKRNNPDVDLQSLLDTAVDKNVLFNIDNIIANEKDSDAKQLLESKSKAIKDEINKKIKERNVTVNTDLSNFNKYIELETTARIYDLLAGSSQEKFTKETNPKTAAKETENEINKTININKRKNFSTFRTNVEAQSKLDKTDTFDTISEKITKLENLINEISTTKLDPFVNKENPLSKLDDDYKTKYIDTLNNRIAYLKNEQNRSKKAETIAQDIETKNKNIKEGLIQVFENSSYFTKDNIRNKFTFTGKTNPALSKYLDTISEEERGGENLFQMLNRIGQEIVEEGKISNENKEFLKSFFTNDEIKKLFNSLLNPQYEELFINELLLRSGYVVSVTPTSNKSTLIEDLEKLANTATLDNTSFEVIDDIKNLTKTNQIVKTPVGTFIIKNFDNTTQGFDTIEDAKQAIISNLNSIKPVLDFKTKQISKVDVDLANKIITELLYDLNGNPIVNETTVKGDKAKRVNITFSKIAEQFFLRTDEVTAEKWFDTLKRAYSLVKLYNTDNRYQFTSYDKIKNLKAFEYRKEFNLEQTSKVYDFSNAELLQETGGEDVINIWLADLLSITENRDENGNIIVSNDQAKQFDLILNSIDTNSNVRLKIDTEFDNGKAFTLNRNNLLKVPIKVEVEDPKNKGNYIKIGAINTGEVIHEGIKYNFDGNDWTDVILSSDPKNRRNETIDNFRLQTIAYLYSDLKEWYKLSKRGKANTEEGNILLENIIENDPYNVIQELLGNIPLNSNDGKRALNHILNIIFFGDNLYGEPSEFNAAKISQRITSWKDKLYRDYRNGLAIRNKIGTDPTVVIQTKVKYKSSGSVIKSVDNKGKIKYKNIRELGKVKLFKTVYNTEKLQLENVNNHSEKINKPNGTYQHALYIGVETKTSNGVETIPVPVQQNTLNGSIVNTEVSDAIINEVYSLIKTSSAIALEKKQNPDRKELLQIDSDNVDEKLKDFVHLEFQTKTKLVDANSQYLVKDYNGFKFLYTDNTGKQTTVYYNLYSQSSYEIANGSDIVQPLTEEEFKLRLGNLRHNVNYKSLNKSFTFNGKNYSTYQQYLIDTNNILTDIGWMVDENGNKISNVASSKSYTTGGIPLIINLDTSNLNVSKDEIKTFNEFKEFYNLDTRYEFIFNLFDNLIQNSEVKFGGILNKDIVDPNTGNKAYVFVDPKSKTLYVTKHWVKHNAENKISSTLLIAHDIIHSLITTLDENSKTNLLNDLTTFKETIINSDQYKQLQSKDVKTDSDNKILTILNLPDVEELLTYGLTDVEFAKFLDTIETDKETKKSALTRFKEIIRIFFEKLGFNTTKLDELNDLLVNYFDSKFKINNQNEVELSNLNLTVDDFNTDFSEFDEYGIDEDIKFSSYISNVNSVNYQFKIVDALNKIQRNKFESSKLQGWINDLIKQGVSKGQIELFKSVAKDGMTKDEIVLELVSKYGFSVEIKISKLQHREENGFPVDNYDTEGNPLPNTYIESTTNSSFYSNLTVPGGTNYTENEISTPLITPSIKGHAQFSTDKGIGWFRSDEQVEGGKYYPGGVFEGEMIGASTEGGNITKTRRILEIQSDLFQKGRDKSLLALTNDQLVEFETLENELEKAKQNNDTILIKIIENKINEAQPRIDKALADNQFLQLLNKDNNWVTFFVKSIIQDSAKRGYEKVLFPKGETAAKIEGHETLAEEISKIDKDIADIDNWNYIKVSDITVPMFNLVELGVTYVAHKDDVIERYGDIELYNANGTFYKTKQQYREKLENRKKQIKDAGIEKLKPIEAFYEIKVGNILEKQFGKENIKTITDEYGNQWYEYQIKDTDLNTIKFSSFTSNNIPLQNEEITAGFRQFDTGKRKLLVDNLQNREKYTKLVKEYNNRKTNYKASIIGVTGNSDTKVSFIAIKLEQRLDIQTLINNGEITYTNELKQLCAAAGIRSSHFSKGSQWEIVKDLKGYPSHDNGGIDIKFTNNGVTLSKNNSEIKAEFGLVIPNTFEIYE